MIGVDPGKRSSQLHGVFRKKVSRERFLAEVSGRGSCGVAMEACESATTGAGRSGRWGSRFAWFRRFM